MAAMHEDDTSDLREVAKILKEILGVNVLIAAQILYPFSFRMEL